MYIPHFLALLTVAGSVVSSDADQMLSSYASGPEPMIITFEGEPLEQVQPLSRTSGVDYTLPSNVIPSEDKSYYTTCITSHGNIKAADCDAVFGWIIQTPASPVDGVIRVEPGTCQIWWSGKCMAKVCAMAEQVYDRPYYEKPEVVVDRMQRDAMDFCVRKGESAVVADHWRYSKEAGRWRYYLQKKHSH